MTRTVSANKVFIPDRPKFPDDPKNRGPQDPMAKLKFRRNIATVTDKKVKEAFINSGATHNFFYSKSSFVNYKDIYSKIIQAAHGETTLIAKGTFILPIAGGIVQGPTTHLDSNPILLLHTFSWIISRC